MFQGVGIRGFGTVSGDDQRWGREGGCRLWLDGSGVGDHDQGHMNDVAKQAEGKEEVMSRACPVCEAEDSVVLEKWSVEPWEVVACESCSMVFLRNPPPPELLKSELDWDVMKNHERDRRRKKNGRLYYFFSDGLKKIRAFFRGFFTRKERRYIERFAEGPKILDVGCGNGRILADLPDGMVPYGIEPSPGMHAEADASFRKKGGFCIHNVSHLGFKELEGNEEFDFVLMRSFLEHDVMAAETLKNCHRRLSKHGKVLIKVPNIGCWNSKLRGSNWPGIRNPDHVNYFTPRTLKKMLKECGYSRVSIPMIWRLPTSDNLWALAYR